MIKSQAQTSYQRLGQEASSLSASTLITLFEIDYSNIFDDTTKPPSTTIFRFHNNIFLTKSSIFYDVDKDGLNNDTSDYATKFLEEFIAAPITADGFEISAKGTLPTPRLGISVNPDGIYALSQLKTAINNFDSLIGAKVTRIRTFLSCLPHQNFPPTTDYPNGFNPYGSDTFAEFPRDIYYIDRKTNENKSVIEFELASILDVEGVQLPQRLVMSDRCPWTYRGDGCFYEYNSRKNSKVHGTNELPTEAPPVATDKDELLSTVLGISVSLIVFPDIDGEWNDKTKYILGNACWIQKNNIKYYYIAKLPSNNKPPPDDIYWVADRCSKLINGCKLRYGIGCQSKNLRPYTKGILPFGGFPGCGKSR